MREGVDWGNGFRRLKSGLALLACHGVELGLAELGSMDWEGEGFLGHAICTGLQCRGKGTMASWW